jgi:uncharacterized phage protein (TIGR02220 family)
MNGYELSRVFWDFAFENPEKIKPYHVAIYFFSIEHCNRLGWKRKFGFPTSMVIESTGMRSYSSYKKYFDDLVSFGFFKVHEYSKNQFSSNIIELTFKVKAHTKALDKALSKHSTKQSQSTARSTVSIDKQITSNNEPLNKEQVDSTTAKAIDFDNLLLFINKTFGREFKTISKAVREKYKARIKEGYTSENIREAMLNCKKNPHHIESNYRYCTPEFFSRSDKLDLYSSINEKLPKTVIPKSNYSYTG